MSEVYDIGEPVLCNGEFKAKVYATSTTRRMTHVIDANGTIFRREDLICYERLTTRRLYVATCVIIQGAATGAWTPVDKELTFYAPTGLSDEELALKAYATVMKKWKTARYTGVRR